MSEENKVEGEKLDKEDIAHLAKIFDLLMQMDERNKREGRYNNGE